MAGRGVVRQRQDWAFKRLLTGASTTAVVAELADREGVSRRTAQNDVRAAYQRLVDDVLGSGVDRAGMAAKLGHLLECSIEKAMAENNPGAVSALSSRLMELYSLVPPASRSGTHGRSRNG
jgi:hypothetical protein